MDRAYALVEIKSFDQDKREFTGIASTPAVDRCGDVVEPQGARFKLPMPVLLHHNATQPVGQVVAAEVTPDGIVVHGRIARIEEAGAVRERVDEAWHSLKAGLIRGLSIGFRALANGVEKLREGGRRFTAWELVEVSLVVVPANAECTVVNVKHYAVTQDGPLDASAGSSTTPRTHPYETKDQYDARFSKNLKYAHEFRSAVVRRTPRTLNGEPVQFTRAIYHFLCRWIEHVQATALTGSPAFEARQVGLSNPALLRADELERRFVALKAEFDSRIDRARSLFISDHDERIRALEARLAELEKRTTLNYCGIFAEGDEYLEGDFVTHAGSLWYCHAAGTCQRPGQGSDWQLAVKRGKAAA